MRWNPSRRAWNAFALACLVAVPALLAVAPPARSTAVQRCATADGAIAYTDGACAAIGARPAPMRIELIGRLVSEARREGREPDLPGALAGDEATSAPARRSPSDGCARTPRQLARDLRGAFALGDVNRVAESYHWAGMSNREGQRTLDRLGHLVGRRAVASRYFAAQIASLGDDGWGDGPRGGDAGILQVVFADDGMQQALEFDVHRYRDCYFVSF
ncbi:MAG TPA: hypothetical protein VFG18_03895 [Xanthomonadaceae bacterium]|nr:hypothetical protein [Xanthomonadaceae bacterium]